ncbi:CDP-glucose 4,6-dehydratase [Sphingopyxis panaciterrae]|uniref:CDP-glucose 4,6-dehydratase n=1 Tax=Sphingopyxis panaciterrae TaxID=363841 RepID=UPI00141E4BC8|nr:CDP-glucose 4,6-dehydratase [Sphingopyxis panaciterrae]
MEALVSGRDIWAGRRVLVTGHTGFKGSWLSLWLHALGAKVTGFALPPPTDPSLFTAAGIDGLLTHVEGDVRDAAALHRTVETCRPEVIFHLAAQPLVRLSYREPVETYATNVMGTVHLLDAARRVPGVQAIVCITSDKCYENREWIWPYRESDAMGGHDPYSSSKGCAELVVSAWRNSFFSGEGPLLASARAGNVIGGGDWADDRLVPDLIRALASGTAPLIRSPGSVRPWQHVLEALHGYLLLAERLFAGERAFADGWNFGPSDEDARPVSWIVERLQAAWGDCEAVRPDTGPRPHEASLLRLDSSKARTALGWRPVLPLDSALEWISDWHRAVAAGSNARAVTIDQIARYGARSG